MTRSQVTEASTAALVAFYNRYATKPVKKFADRKTAERRVLELVAAMAEHGVEPLVTPPVAAPAADMDGSALTHEPTDAPTAEQRAAADAAEHAAQTAAPKPAKVSKRALRAAEKEAAAALVAARLAAHHCVHCGATDDQTGNGPEGTFKGDNELFCHHCGGAYDAATGARRASMHGGISASRSAAIAASWKDPETAARRATRMKVRADGQDFKSVAEAFRALKLPLVKHIKFRGELRDAGALDFTHGDRTVHFELIHGDQ